MYYVRIYVFVRKKNENRGKEMNEKEKKTKKNQAREKGGWEGTENVSFRVNFELLYS